MITREEFELLRSEELRADVARNIGRGHLEVALDKRLANALLVAAQVKYLQRAKAKLPSYYDARCVIPSLAFEQSSSERTAAGKEYAGGLCIDLTCGLGVDSFGFSKRFDRVVAVERNAVLADVTAYNMTLLGAANVEVVCASAEEFVAGYDGPRADMLYLDPDRRSDDGRKLVTLEDCSPNVLELLPRLREIARRVVVKLSPMFDVDEAFRVFGGAANVEVVSLGGECKEVLVELGDDVEEARISACVVEQGRVAYPWPVEAGQAAERPQQPRYLVVPDVALAKARMAVRYYAERGVWIEDNNAFGFCTAMPEKLFGKVYEIDSIADYSPKALKKSLKTSGVKRLNVLRKNFAASAQAIAKELGVAEGGEASMAFTRIDGRPVAISLRRLK